MSDLPILTPAQAELMNYYREKRPRKGEHPKSYRLVEAVFAERPGEPLTFSEIARGVEAKRQSDESKRGTRKDDAAAERRRAWAGVATSRGLRQMKSRVEHMPDGKYRLAGRSSTPHVAIGRFRYNVNALCDLLAKWEEDKPSPYVEPTRRQELRKTVRKEELARDRVRAVRLLVTAIDLLPSITWLAAEKVADRDTPLQAPDPAIEREASPAWFASHKTSARDRSMGDVERMIASALTEARRTRAPGAKYLLRDLPYHLHAVAGANIAYVLARLERQQRGNRDSPEEYTLTAWKEDSSLALLPPSVNRLPPGYPRSAVLRRGLARDLRAISLARERAAPLRT
jgi:hypothetical protein